MAEEQFTSRRARREAERLAADQAFEARETPEQPSEPSSNNRGELLNPPPATAEEPESRISASEPEPSSAEPEPAETTSRFDAEPRPHDTHERGALATDHAQAAHPPVNAEERLDPQRAPLPHFGSRTARKNYLREHGLSLEGDVSTGAIPVIAGPEETSPEESDEATAAEDESFDTAGFSGSADEVAARDFESPVTADSAPRPTALDDAPDDALSQPIEDLDAEDSATDQTLGPDEPAQQEDAASSASEQSAAQPKGPAPSAVDGGGLNEESNDERDATARPRRMPIVQPPSSSGVRVVTAASAQIPEVDGAEATTDADADAPQASMAVADSRVSQDEEAAPTANLPGPDASADESYTADKAAYSEETGFSSDDAARALAANPETRPMETVPEAWALPNPDYEDEETENPPGTRIRASAVTGHDGRILVGEEPSKVPYVVLGVAALFAVALIVIALVILL